MSRTRGKFRLRDCIYHNVFTCYIFVTSSCLRIALGAPSCDYLKRNANAINAMFRHSHQRFLPSLNLPDYTHPVLCEAVARPIWEDVC